MSELFQANRQWMKRGDDERFLSLDDMQKHFDTQKALSHATVVETKRVEVVPGEGMQDIALVVDNRLTSPTHHAFGQLAQLATMPVDLMRRLPAPLVADNMNYGLKFERRADEFGALVTEQNGSSPSGMAELRAATGPRYGRIWNAEVVQALRDRFGDGISGEWKVPGKWGRPLDVNTKEDTTLYASDHDMFVFLADEANRIEMPNRRNGQPGALARGFFVWNGEVGDTSFGFGQFLFDFVCGNRIVWGAQEYQEVRIRHSSGAPDRFLSEIKPALLAYQNSASSNVLELVEQARAKKLDDDLDDFLANRFGKRMGGLLKAVHEAEENRPIETLWDVTTAATAYARGMSHTDDRVKIERIAGDVLKLAA